VKILMASVEAITPPWRRGGAIAQAVVIDEPEMLRSPGLVEEVTRLVCGYVRG